jgi:hypothetical protein
MSCTDPLRDPPLNEVSNRLWNAQFLAYDGIEGELAEEKRGCAGDIATEKGINKLFSSQFYGLLPSFSLPKQLLPNPFLWRIRSHY